MNGKGTDISVINIKTIFWELLSQWKAILIVSIITMLVVTGLKYARDTKSYNSWLDERTQMDAQSELSMEEKIDTILGPLSDGDKSDVEYVIKEKEWIRTQRDYLNKSILLNVDPTNQRTISLNYRITSSESRNLTALVYAYLGHLYDSDVLERVGSVIDPEADGRYIAELINYDINKYTNIGADITDIVVEVRIVIPEDVEAESVERILTACLKEYTSELSRQIGENQIAYLSLKEFRRFNNEATNNKTNITYSIYNIQNNIKNGSSLLSDEANAAIEAIDAIMAAEYEAASKDERSNNADILIDDNDLAKPGISKKFALLGFVLGAMIYAFFYMLLVVMKGNITSSADVGYYTGNRLLGEIYKQIDHKGISTLFCSRFVNAWRYRDLQDEEKQLSRVVSSVEAICKHIDVDKISFLCTSNYSDVEIALVDAISKSCNEHGIVSETLEISEDLNEMQLESAKNGIIIAGRGSQASLLTKITELCSSFDVRLLGDIYVQGV